MGEGNFEELVPHTALEVGTREVKGDIEIAARACEVLGELLSGAREVLVVAGFDASLGAGLSRGELGF